jgi:hypothetical protein
MKINAIGQLVKANPIQTQSKPISSKAKMNVNSLITKDYERNDIFAVQKNKPNQTQSAGCQRSDICLLPSVFCLLSMANYPHFYVFKAES